MNPVDIPDVLTEDLHNKLSSLAVATITHQLQGRGIQHAFLSGLRPLHPHQRLVGRARTLRYVALREDRVSSSLQDRMLSAELLRRSRTAMSL